MLREEGAEGAEALVVVQELQRGYRFHERVLRPTMVKVGRPKATEPSADDSAASGPTDAAERTSDAPPESPSDAVAGKAE